MLEDAEAGAFGVVLVHRLDRLGRSLKSLLAGHDRLDKADAAIRSGTEPFDTTSPIGKFLFSLLASYFAHARRERFWEGQPLAA